MAVLESACKVRSSDYTGVIGRQEAKPKAKKGHTMNIKTIIETLENQGFYEVDSLDVMGCDVEEIEAARGVVTVEPEYNFDSTREDGQVTDMVTVDGRRFARSHDLAADLPMTWQERRRNEQLWQLFAASLGGRLVLA